MSSPAFIIDKNFGVKYYVTIWINDKENKRLINSYGNMNNIREIEDEPYIVFERVFDNLQDAMIFYIIQHEIDGVDVSMGCEYCYHNVVVGQDIVDNIYQGFGRIADKSCLYEIEVKNKIINDLEDQLKTVKPVLDLPNKKFKEVLEYSKNILENCK